MNDNPNMRFHVTCGSVQHRFKKLITRYRHEDAHDRIRSGTGGERKDVDEMLTIVESMHDMREPERQNKEEETKAEVISKLEGVFLRLLLLVAREILVKVRKTWKMIEKKRVPPPRVANLVAR